MPANPDYVGPPPKVIVDIWGQVIVCGLALLKSVNQMIIDNINVMNIDNLSCLYKNRRGYSLKSLQFYFVHQMGVITKFDIYKGEIVSSH